MYDVLDCVDRAVDGFRVDVLWLFGKSSASAGLPKRFQRIGGTAVEYKSIPAIN